MNMSDRVASALMASGRSPSDLAREIGISTARISQLKAGMGGIKAENLFSLARATGFSAQWLAEGTGSQRSTPNDLPEYVVIKPVIRISTTPMSTPSDSSNCGIAFDRSWILALSPREQSLRYFTGTDATMAPAITSMDIMLIDEEQKTPVDRGVYLIFKSNGMPVVKRLVQTLTGSWILRSDDENKRHYPDETLDEAQLSLLDIAGRVIWRGGPAL